MNINGPGWDADPIDIHLQACGCGFRWRGAETGYCPRCHRRLEDTNPPPARSRLTDYRNCKCLPEKESHK